MLTDQLPSDEQGQICCLAGRVHGARWPKQRAAAARKLGAMGQGATAALEALVSAARLDPDRKVREAAEQALGQILVSKAAVRDALGSDRPDVRIAGIQAGGARNIW